MKIIQILGHVVCAAVGALSVSQAVAEPKPGWKLVWVDEFEVAGAPDPEKWVYEKGMLRNKEAQLYTEDRRENVRVENGSLVIETRKERLEVPDKPGKTAEYTSGSIHTRGKAGWLYGRVEVRAKLPRGRGIWPAIWMTPTDLKMGWPECGEIDIMEYVGYEPNTIHGTVHTADYNHVKKTQKAGRTKLEKPWEDYHLYAIEWDKESIRFFVDDTLYFTFNNEGKGEGSWPFDKAFCLRLNTAVGGGWGGAMGIDDSIFPQSYFIDYVRVYQKVQNL